jgi:hypothetical protein
MARSSSRIGYLMTRPGFLPGRARIYVADAGTAEAASVPPGMRGGFGGVVAADEAGVGARVADDLIEGGGANTDVPGVSPRCSEAAACRPRPRSSALITDAATRSYIPEE